MIWTWKKRVFTPIDLAGGLLVVAGLSVMVWFGWLKRDSAALELDQIRNQTTDMQSEHSRLQKIIARSQLEYQQTKESAEREGKLVTQLDLEDRLRGFRDLTGHHGWTDLQIIPVQWRSAEDVAEQTFNVTATCTYEQLLNFFHDFEVSSNWADISYFKAAAAPKAFLDTPEQCTVEFTLHFYSGYTASKPNA